MRRRAWLAGGLLTLTALVLPGCATPTVGRKPPEAGAWAGRLGLVVAAEPPQSLYAGFDLRGSALEGELTLTTPLGNILATLRWSPLEASLHTGQDTRRFDSVEALTRHVTGTALPIGALFDWLGGVDTAAGGWTADLTRLADGRLVARRTEPAPAAELKLILDR